MTYQGMGRAWLPWYTPYATGGTVDGTSDDEVRAEQVQSTSQIVGFVDR